MNVANYNLCSQLLKSRYEEQLEQLEDLTSLFDELVAQTNDNNKGLHNSEQLDGKVTRKEGQLPKKRFRAQPSLLTYVLAVSSLIYGQNRSILVNCLKFHISKQFITYLSLVRYLIKGIQYFAPNLPVINYSSSRGQFKHRCK